MTDVTGEWNMTIKAPTGEQKGTLTLKASGDDVTGNFSGNGESVDITDGKLSGDTLRWTMDISKPMPLKLKSEVKVDGDALTGTVAVGAFGSFPLTGTRA